MDWEEEARKERRREIVRESQRRRRAAAEENGLCIVCVCRPARKGLKTCKECCDYIAGKQKIRRGTA